ncbi:MAG TPA: 3'-5' exonuclease, partial [Candidatus Baltobacteraceae bacterium]|nr:3'-5' exonuclease [Candidatus Baltobacteraceae bacterium]
SFEEILRRLAVRHRVVGGFSFYERAEVRNALAYVRLLFHPEDDVALLRVLNVPPRGIGATTVAAIEARAKEKGKSLWETIGDAEFLEGKRAAGALRYFRGMMEDLREECRELAPSHLIERVLDKSGYLGWVEQEDNLEHTTRAENLRELSNAMAEATEQGQTLEDVLDRAALVADSDEYDESVPVSLMTLHSAKGLEFEAVFLAGLEEGILPHSRSTDTNAEIEEERRLFYVGMTRAKKSLVLSRAVYRRSYGEDRLRASLPSRFLAEVPGDLIEAAEGSQSEPGETRRYEPDPEFSEGYGYRRAPRQAYGQPNYGRGGYGSASYGRPPASRAAGSKSNSARSSKDPLVGMRVRHSKYGIGTIIEVEGEGEERKLTVSFQDYGPKKLVERYANLQIA